MESNKNTIPEELASGPDSGVRGVDTVFFWVKDLELSSRWYKNKLKIPPGRRYGDWQILKVEGTTRLALHGGAVGPAVPNAVVALRVDGLDDWIKHLRMLGVQPVDKITDTGVARFITIADPDGNHIQLIERPMPEDSQADTDTETREETSTEFGDRFDEKGSLADVMVENSS